MITAWGVTPQPEYGNFTFPHRYGISEIRLMQIADADALRISDADGGAVHGGKT